MLDVFTFWAALVVGVVCLVDVLMYPTERKLLSERVAQWWVIVEDTRFAGFVSNDAARIARMIKIVFGEHAFKLRFIFLATSASLIALSLAFLTRSNFIGAPKDVVNHGFWVGLYFATPLGAWMSLATTLGCLLIMGRTTHPLILTATIGLDLALTAILFMSTLWLAITVNFLSVYFLSNGPLAADFSVSFLLHYLDVADRFVPGSRIGLVVAALVCALPSLLHLSIAAIFLLSRLFRPILKPLLARALYAFHESKRGLLSAAAAVIGVLAKVIELGVKAYR